MWNLLSSLVGLLVLATVAVIVVSAIAGSPVAAGIAAAALAFFVLWALLGKRLTRDLEGRHRG